jgi:cell division protein FtsL
MAGEAIRKTEYFDSYRGNGYYAPMYVPTFTPIPKAVPATEAVPVPVPLRDVFGRPSRIILSVREKMSIFFLIVVIGVLFFGTIFTSAYCAGLQKDINLANAQAALVQEEIDKLNIEIETGRNISSIEKSAKKKLKMDYPADDKIKYIDKMKYNKDDLAQYLREKAYG